MQAPQDFGSPMSIQDSDSAPGTPREPRGHAEQDGVSCMDGISGSPGICGIPGIPGLLISGIAGISVDCDWDGCDIEPDRPRTPESAGERAPSWSPMSPFTKKRLLAKYPWMEQEGFAVVQSVHAKNSTVLRIRLDSGRYVCKKECPQVWADEVAAWNEDAHVHPNVVRWVFLSESNISTAAMLYVPGVNMQEYLAIHDRVPDSDLLGIGRQILRGLVFLHCEKQTAHGDMNMRNVMLDAASGHVVLVDIDNSIRLSYGRRTGEPVVLKGCTSAPCIMSPETARVYTDGLEVRMPADVWAVGMLLLFMLHGVHVRVLSCLKNVMIHPYDSEPMAYMFWLMNLGSRPVVVGSTRAPPQWAEDMLAGCLRPDPAERDISAAVLRSLEEARIS